VTAVKDVEVTLQRHAATPFATGQAIQKTSGRKVYSNLHCVSGGA
jgi:hypothetical protein